MKYSCEFLKGCIQPLQSYDTGTGTLGHTGNWLDNRYPLQVQIFTRFSIFCNLLGLRNRPVNFQKLCLALVKLWHFGGIWLDIVTGVDFCPIFFLSF